MIRIVTEAQDVGSISDELNRLNSILATCPPDVQKTAQSMVRSISVFMKSDFIGALSSDVHNEISTAIQSLSIALIDIGEGFNNNLVGTTFLPRSALQRVLFDKEVLQLIRNVNVRDEMQQVVQSFAEGDNQAKCANLQKAVIGTAMSKLSLIERALGGTSKDRIQKAVYDCLAKKPKSSKGGGGMYDTPGMYENLLAFMLSVPSTQGGSSKTATTDQKSPDIKWNDYDIEVKNNTEHVFTLYAPGISQNPTAEIDYFARPNAKNTRLLIVKYPDVYVFSNSSDVWKYVDYNIVNPRKGGVECWLKK